MGEGRSLREGCEVTEESLRVRDVPHVEGVRMEMEESLRGFQSNDGNSQLLIKRPEAQDH